MKQPADPWKGMKEDPKTAEEHKQNGLKTLRQSESWLLVCVKRNTEGESSTVGLLNISRGLHQEPLMLSQTLSVLKSFIDDDFGIAVADGEIPILYTFDTVVTP